MLFFMFSFLLLSSLCSGLSPAGLLHAGERSELRAAAPQETMAHLMQGLLSPLILRLFKSWLCPAFPLSLLRQGKQTGAPAQETPVACASSFNPRMAFGQSVAQQEPHMPSAPNSNRCLSYSLGCKLACIRKS